MFKRIISKFKKAQPEVQPEVMPEQFAMLPPEVRLLKNLPTIKAGTIFYLTPKGYYEAHSKDGNYAAYGWNVVINCIDWFKPLTQEESGQAWWDV